MGILLGVTHARCWLFQSVGWGIPHWDGFPDSMPLSSSRLLCMALHCIAAVAAAIGVARPFLLSPWIEALKLNEDHTGQE